MALSKLLIALGNWIEKRFPEKLTATEVARTFAIYVQSLDKLTDELAEVNEGQAKLHEQNAALTARIADLEKKSEMLNSDMNKTKVMLITQRQTAGR